MWNPSLDSLKNVEEDEAGRLRAFREKFGRGWDVESTGEGGEGMEEREESLIDLISGYGLANAAAEDGKAGKKASEKGKK